MLNDIELYGHHLSHSGANNSR